jgi:hypothetical protein
MPGNVGPSYPANNWPFQPDSSIGLSLPTLTMIYSLETNWSLLR